MRGSGCLSARSAERGFCVRTQLHGDALARSRTETARVVFGRCAAESVGRIFARGNDVSGGVEISRERAARGPRCADASCRVLFLVPRYAQPDARRYGSE